MTERSGLKADPPPIHTPNYSQPVAPPAGGTVEIPNAWPVIRGPRDTALRDGSRVEQTERRSGDGVPAVHTPNHQPPINRTPRAYRAGKPGM